MSIEEWAERFQVPNRRRPGTFLSGSEIQSIIGPVESKSWDPEFFRDFDRIVAVAREAMNAAAIGPSDVDLLIVTTSTPYEVHLDSDSFRLLRALGIRDSVPPFQAAAGCAGMARALALAARIEARNILVVTYEVSSLYMESPIYRHNTKHPLRDALWASPALFSDGAAAVALRRDDGAHGLSVYCRDSLAFGDEPGFADPLIHFPGGGALHPPGTEHSAELSCYGMAGAQTKRYYAKGMMLNHEDLLAHRPDYLRQVRRVYTHQSSPIMVENFISAFCDRERVDRDLFSTNVRQFGNLVIPSTLKLMHDDLRTGRLERGDEVAVLVVGAGPERGGYTIGIE
jgi:3-oxoacyl-[acyl-carrier-protein] synthase-3